MGSPEEEPGRYPDEGPQHRVTIGRGFWLATAPVTQAQYAAVTGQRPSRFQNAGDQAPVEQVSWDECRAFCDTLQRKVAELDKTLQDELNHRRSRALFMLNSRQVIGEKGAVDDVNVARKEVAKPDGYIEVNPGMRFEYAPTADLAQGQFNLYLDTRNAFAMVGPNDALQGKSGDISGRAKQLDQEGGGE